MKFKLLYAYNEFHLLQGDGDYNILDKEQARQLIINYGQLLSQEPLDDDIPDYFNDYEGELILSIDNNSNLIIHNSELFKDIFTYSNDDFPYISLSQYAEAHTTTTSNVRKKCRAGRVEGALLVGSYWIIPKDSPYPDDLRYKDFSPENDTEQQY